MRDRTIILLALLFLVLSVGAGVNRSLAAGNKMLGKQMAPSADQIYQQQAPLVQREVEVLAAYGKAKGLAVRRQYPFLARELQEFQAQTKQKIMTVAVKWRDKLSDTVNWIKTNTLFEKKRVIQ